MVCRGIDDHGPRLSRFAASATRRSGLPGAPSVRSLAGRSPETAWVAVRTVRRCPSVRFLTLIPRFPGDRRAPEAESRGPYGPVRQAAPFGSGRRATARRSPAGRETAFVWRSVRLAGVPRFGFLRSSPGFRGIDERRRPSRGGPAVCGGQVPPRLGSQGDRLPVPRGSGDSVCMAVPGLRRRPPGGPEPRSPIGRRTTSSPGGESRPRRV